MNREILFRGKDRFTRKWRFGDFMHGNERKTLRDSIWEYQPDTQNYLDYQVDPATMGQYTGLTDRNGVKIFEGDIVKHIAVDVVLEIIYDISGFKAHRPKFDSVHNLNDGMLLEVIGNIHDNPELLEVQP